MQTSVPESNDVIKLLSTGFSSTLVGRSLVKIRVQCNYSATPSLPPTHCTWTSDEEKAETPEGKRNREEQEQGCHNNYGGSFIHS